MKELILSILILFSFYNYSTKTTDKRIPVIVVISEIEESSIKYNKKDLEKTIFKEVFDFYKSTSKGKIHLYNPLEESFIVVTSDEKFNYNNRKTFGLKNVSKASEVIDYSKFDTNNNKIIDRDELILINILETEDTYKQPIASTIKTKEFYVENLKIESFIQLGIQEVFSNRESLLTPSTISHEIGHYFGLPDLYDTDYSSNGLGPMSLMSEIHSDQPINFDPWSKMYLGIEKPLKLKAEGIYKIEEDRIYLVETHKNWIYYLIEKRTFNGHDKSLAKVMPSEGIYIYQVNEKVINETIELNHVNRDETNMGVKFLGNEVINKGSGISLKVIDSSHLSIENKKNN